MTPDTIIILIFITTVAALLIYLIIYVKHGGETDLTAIEDRLDENSAAERRELTSHFSQLGEMTVKNMAYISADTKNSVDKLEGSVSRMMQEQRYSSDAQSHMLKEENASLRREIVSQFAGLNELSVRTMSEISGLNSKSMTELKETVEQNLREISEKNEASLALMRQAIENRLSESISTGLEGSFKSVSSQLEQLYTSIGHMQSLTSDVTDLKKILGNVKNRGSWGEMQLGTLLSDMLAPSQFEKEKMLGNGKTRVDYAVRLPADDGSVIWLPVDSKFPLDKYSAVLTMAESADTEGYRKAVHELRQAAAESAKSIAKKYILPPETTDFAVMFVPSEGLFSMLQEDGFAYSLNSGYKVLLTGPSGFSAILSSVQTAFRSMAIRKNSEELFKLLMSVKRSFANFEKELEQASRSLVSAQNNIEKVSRSTGKLSGQLKQIEENSGIPEDTEFASESV